MICYIVSFATGMSLLEIGLPSRLIDLVSVLELVGPFTSGRGASNGRGVGFGGGFFVQR